MHHHIPGDWCCTLCSHYECRFHDISCWWYNLQKCHHLSLSLAVPVVTGVRKLYKIKGSGTILWFWLQPMTTTAWRRRRRVHLTRAATLTWSTQIRWVAAAYSLSHSYMMANSDVCITTYLVIDAAPSVHTMSADFMIFPSDGIASRYLTISVLA